MLSRRLRLALLGVALCFGSVLAGAAEEPPQTASPQPANPANSAVPEDNPVKLDDTYANLRQQLQALQQDNQQLKAGLAAAQTAAADQLKAGTTELAILRVAAAKQTDVNNHLHQQLTDAQDQITKLTAQLKTLQAQPAPAAAPAPTATAGLTQLKQQLDDARKQAEASRAQSAEAGKQLADASSQLSAIHAQLDEAHKQLADANAQLADAKTAAAATAAAPAASASQLADTQDRLATALRSYSLLEKDNAGLKASSHDLAAQISVLEVELAAAHTKVNDLSKQLQAASTQAGAAGSLRAQLQVTQAQLQSLATENAWLRQQNPTAATPPAGDIAEPTRPVASWPRAYTVVAGDTLAKISQQAYGTPSRWHDIYLANRAQLDHAGALVVGMQLELP